MLTPHQHEFCKGKSCLTNLLESLDECIDAVDHGSGVTVILLDFKKTFDSVSYHHMMEKLPGYEICGNLLKWLPKFCATQTTKSIAIVINGTYSNWISVTIGVPQGLVLGSLLLLLYINDIRTRFNSCSLKLFAGDAKM